MVSFYGTLQRVQGQWRWVEVPLPQPPQFEVWEPMQPIGDCMHGWSRMRLSPLESKSPEEVVGETGYTVGCPIVKALEARGWRVAIVSYTRSYGHVDVKRDYFGEEVHLHDSWMIDYAREVDHLFPTGQTTVDGRALYRYGQPVTAAEALAVLDAMEAK